MVEFAFPILLCQTLHLFNLYLGPRARPRCHPITVWAPPSKEITTLAGPRSQISQGLRQSRCLKSQVGKRCRWLARRQTSQPSQVLCEKLLPHELFYPGSFLCTLVVVRYTLYLYIYFLFSRKMAFSLLTDCQHICMSFGALSACGWSLHHCTHRHCIHSYLHGVLFSLSIPAID
jgi:hypothetical protein